MFNRGDKMKKFYLIEWRCSWGCHYSDIVKARDIEQAWRKLKWKHFFDRPREFVAFTILD